MALVCAENHAIVSGTETEWSGNYANYGNGAGLYAENSVEIYSTDKWKKITATTGIATMAATSF